MARKPIHAEDVQAAPCRLTVPLYERMRAEIFAEYPQDLDDSMTRTPIQCFGRFSTISVRLDHIVHIDSMLIDWHFFGPTRLLLETEFNDVREALVAGGMRLPAVVKAENSGRLEALLQDLLVSHSHALGFLVKTRQPYFQIEGDRLGYCWEVSRGQWFYARSYEDVLDRIGAWGEAFHHQAWARAGRS